jgi:uncharacterized protein (DUF2147 family)
VGLKRAGATPVLAALLLASAPASAAPSIFGRWVTEDRSALIRIDRCGARLCGSIERVLNPKAPTHDVNNPDPALRTRPLVGVPVLAGFSGSGAKWDGGEAYDPKAGRSYHSRLALEDGNRLRVTGCVLFLCRSLIWTREGADPRSSQR